MTITFVKKVLATGEACRKCADVEARLRDGGHMARIDHIVVADERDPGSEGMRIAARYNVELAPFFVVETGGKTVVYTVFLRFLKEILGTGADHVSNSVESVDEAEDILRANPELDLI